MRRGFHGAIEYSTVSETVTGNGDSALTWLGLCLFIEK